MTNEKFNLDKDTATQLLVTIMALEPYLNKVDRVVSGIIDPALKARYATALGNIFQIVTMDFVLPIVSQYPELDPDKPQ